MAEGLQEVLSRQNVTRQDYIVMMWHMNDLMCFGI